MRLHRLRIKGLRRIEEAEFLFGDTTFLIGANNAGKSTVLEAIDRLLTPKANLQPQDYHSVMNDEDGDSQCKYAESAEIEGEFRNIPAEAVSWRGFKGRIFKYMVPIGSAESGFGIIYKKTFSCKGSPSVAVLSYPKKLKTEYEDAKTIEDCIKLGMNKEDAQDIFGVDEGKLLAKHKKDLEQYNDAWEIDESKQEWVENPGGFQSIFASKLPKFIKIPLDDGRGEITDKNGALTKIMEQLFSEVRNSSENFKKAQEYLNLLTAELNPQDESTPFGQLMDQLNGVLSGVFDQAKFHAIADLSKPDEVIKPTFDYKMSSNVPTPVSLQGSGMIRSAVFALLKFRQEWIRARGETSSHGILVGFEEPEIYLHPNAANQMRDTIYELSSDDAQIICTTHSPFMVDLSRKERQVLNSIKPAQHGVVNKIFSVTEKFLELQGDDQSYVKMVLKIDDYAARVFFADHVVIVEGDTEDIVLRETIRRMPSDKRKSILCGAQVIKARGKAAIISLVKYLKAFGVNPIAMHDSDIGCENAEKFNNPIAEALGDPQCQIMLDNCIEDVLGYKPPTYNKPYTAYKLCNAWGPSWEDVPKAWREKMQLVFAPFFV